jgi:hypothetical protein
MISNASMSRKTWLKSLSYWQETKTFFKWVPIIYLKYYDFPSCYIFYFNSNSSLILDINTNTLSSNFERTNKNSTMYKISAQAFLII